MRGAAKRAPRQGLFITLEGPEGSGKTTQIRHLAAALRRSGYHVAVTREPGGTSIAEQIRSTLLQSSPRERVTPEAEALLILAARSQHVAHLIAPALEQGTIVLCDRFSDSTFAYQGYARKLPLQWLKSANRIATRGCTPDLTILFDIPVEVGLARRRNVTETQNRLDRESDGFHLRVRKGFLALAARSRGRIKTIDAHRPENVVRAELVSFVLGWVTRRMGKRRRR